jgi:hypothetical protein
LAITGKPTSTAQWNGTLQLQNTAKKICDTLTTVHFKRNAIPQEQYTAKEA